MENLPQKEEGKLPERKEEKPIQISNVQAEMEKLIPYAGTIELTDKQKEILFSPVKEEDVEIRPDGLVYLPWMEYVGRLRDAFGISWAIIPNGLPKPSGNFLYWPFYLMINGKLAGFAVGEQEYSPNNYRMTYGDAAEGAKSNALMRLCKGLGISLELWKPSFVRTWKEKYAESYEGKNKRGEIITLWRKKNGKHGPEVIESTASEDEMEAFKKESEKKFSELHDRMQEIKNGFELSAWWKKHQPEIKSLMPECLQLLTDFKDSLKAKFGEVKDGNA